MAKKKATPKKAEAAVGSRGKNPPKKAASSEHSRTERALAAALKRHRGEKLNQAERRDLAWHDRTTREAMLDEALHAIPKGLFCQMAGRQQKVIDDAAKRYDLPLDEGTIDLFAALKCYHDLIAANARALRPADDAKAGADSDIDESSQYDLRTAKLREEVRQLKQKNAVLEVQVTRERGDVIDRGALHDILGWLSARLEGFGQQLRRSSGGVEAQKALNEFLESLAHERDHGVLRT